MLILGKICKIDVVQTARLIDHDILNCPVTNETRNTATYIVTISTVLFL